MPRCQMIYNPGSGGASLRAVLKSIGVERMITPTKRSACFSEVL